MNSALDSPGRAHGMGTVPSVEREADVEDRNRLLLRSPPSASGTNPRNTVLMAATGSLDTLTASDPAKRTPSFPCVTSGGQVCTVFGVAFPAGVTGGTSSGGASPGESIARSGVGQRERQGQGQGHQGQGQGQ